MLVRILAIAVLLLCYSIGHAEEKMVEIPLTEIWSTNQGRMWAVDEPVTKYFGQVLKNDSPNQLLLTDISKALSSGAKDKADPAFAVEGEDREALRNAHAVLTGKQERPTSLSTDKNVSIAFFALESGYYISITDAQKQGDTIRIKYEFIPHITDNVSSSLSLIPLGKLSVGHYQVEIDHEPFEKRFAKFGKSGPHKSALESVSKSFEFDVKWTWVAPTPCPR